MTRMVDMDALDDLAGEWRSVHNLLMVSAVNARMHARTPFLPLGSDFKLIRFAEACERVALELSEREGAAA